MPDYLKTIGDLAAAAAGVITVISLLVLLYKGALFFADVPNRVRTYFFYKPRYILVPTPEELAKYCEKSFDSHKITRDEEYEERSYILVRFQRRFTATSRSRVRVLYHFFLCVFALFGARLLYLGLMRDGADVMSSPYVLVAAFFWAHIVLFSSLFTFRRESGYVAPLTTARAGAVVKRFLAED